MKDPVKRVIILSAVARDLTGTKRIQQSQDLFGQAASIATTIQNSEGGLIARGVLAKHRAEAGDTAAAKALLSQIIREMESGVKTPPELGQHQAEAFSALVSEATGIEPVLLDAERVIVRDNCPLTGGKTLHRYAAALGAAARNL